MLKAARAAGIDQGNDAGRSVHPHFALRQDVVFGEGHSINRTGVFPSILHQNPRYFYQGSGSVKSSLVPACRHVAQERGHIGDYKEARERRQFQASVATNVL